MNKHKCPVCEDSRVKSVKSIKDYPAIVFPVDDGLKDSVDTSDIIICSCDECTHVFQVDVDLQFNADIYTKYYEFYPFSNIECFINHYRKPFERVMSYISVETAGKELLEIGVSSESQLDYFRTLGYTTTGISPEHSNNTEIVSSFYEDHEFSKKFDCIVSRFNLEHIVDLNVFLSKVKKDLKTDGQFVVQVPNTSCFEKNKILNYYAHEHIHYFNRCSLLKLFSKHGMDIALVSEKNAPSIIAVARNSERESEYPQTYPDEIEKVRCQITNLVRQHNGRVIVYGACLSLTGVLYFGDLEENIKDKLLIVDDNPQVHGLHMPMVQSKIVPIEEVGLEESDLVILLLNAAYHEKVLSKIHKTNPGISVYCLNESGLSAKSL